MRGSVILLAGLCLVAQAVDNAAIAPQFSAAPRPTVVGHQSPVVGGAEAITIPQMLSYQGRLTDTLGQPVADTLYAIRFRLYAQSSGGTHFWEEDQEVRTKDGLFSVLLGSVTTISSVPDAGALYLGMAVAGGSELAPRLRIASAAYAYLTARAADADLLQGKDTTGFVRTGQENSVTSAMIFNGTIFAEDLNQMGAGTGQVLKWTGSAWSPRNDSIGGGGADSAWVRGTPDSVLFTIRKLGIARGGAGNVLHGTAAHTHVNFGDACTTGASGQNRAYCVIAGGQGNVAGAGWATVGGGSYNRATGASATVAGGAGNQATLSAGTVSGGANNYAAGQYASVAGGSGNAAGGTYACVGGGDANVASGYCAAVAGGKADTAIGAYSAALSGLSNQSGDVTDDTCATVVGGYANLAGGAYAFVGGGRSNDATGYAATIAGGHNSDADSTYATVGGGYSNDVTGYAATVAGGFNNGVDSRYATVGGGYYNYAFGEAATVAGGRNNEANSSYATVGGGYYNTASGTAATVPGGYQCDASGTRSFAAGSHARARGAGSFVWSDSCTSGDSVRSIADNRWVARARGGVYFYTSLDKSTGSYLEAGGSSWNSVSDSMTKENFCTVDKRALLEALARMRVRDYNLKTQDKSIRHIGPVAQDFYGAFGFGESNTAINMEDADGVALAAIQALYEQNQALGRRVAELEAKLGKE